MSCHPALQRRISNASFTRRADGICPYRRTPDDHVGREAYGFVDIFIGIPVYKIFGITGSSSRCSGKVRVGFAGRSATEKPIPLSNGAAANILLCGTRVNTILEKSLSLPHTRLREHEEQSRVGSPNGCGAAKPFGVRRRDGAGEHTHLCVCERSVVRADEARASAAQRGFPRARGNTVATNKRSASACAKRRRTNRRRKPPS